MTIFPRLLFQEEAKGEEEKSPNPHIGLQGAVGLSLFVPSSFTCPGYRSQLAMIMIYVFPCFVSLLF